MGSAEQMFLTRNQRRVTMLEHLNNEDAMSARRFPVIKRRVDPSLTSDVDEEGVPRQKDCNNGSRLGMMSCQKYGHHRLKLRFILCFLNMIIVKVLVAWRPRRWHWNWCGSSRCRWESRLLPLGLTGTALSVYCS